VIFARFVLKESLTLKKILSLLLATIGIGIVVGWNPNLGNYFWGSVILVGAAVTWALLSVRKRNRYKPILIVKKVTDSMNLAFFLSIKIALFLVGNQKSHSEHE
jgi:drug/metabolite transporter (DMT)-like permease